MSCQSASVNGVKFAAVELVGSHHAVRIPDIDGAAGGQRKEIGAGVRLRLPANAAAFVKFHAVDNDKTAVFKDVTGHERLGQKVQGGAVNDYFGTAHGIDERPAGGVAHDIHLAALGAVHEGLTDVAMDHQLAPLHNLAQLVLGVAVHLDLHAVDARGQIVPGTAVHVDPDAIAFQTEAATGEALTFVPVNQEVLPTQIKGLHLVTGVAVIPLRRETGGIQYQNGIGLGGRGEAAPGLPIKPAVPAWGGFAHFGGGLEDVVQGIQG